MSLFFGSLYESSLNTMGGSFDSHAIRGMACAALAAGLHYWATQPASGAGWCLVALVPLMAAARWDAADAAAPDASIAAGAIRRSVATGALYGLLLTVAAIYWAVPLLPTVYGFGALKTLGVAVAFTLFATAAYLMLYLAMVRAACVGWAPSLTGGPFLVCLELVYPRMPPQYLGASLVPATAWVQMADLGGPLLLTLWVGLVNGLVLEVGTALARRRAVAPLHIGLAALLLGAPALYGAHRMRAVEEELAARPTLRVGIVQPDRPMYVGDDDVEPIYAALREGTRRVLARGPIDLVLWPEGAPPDAVSPDLATVTPWLPEGLGGAALLFGATTEPADDPGGPRRASAFLAGPDGHIAARYDKIALFPFGEYVPFGDRFPGLYDFFGVEEKRPGVASPVLVDGSLRLGVLICYEDLLPAFVRLRVLPGNPGLLVNLTNDGWFFETPGAAIHMRLARLRAVEHHRYLVRATNHGISGVVDPLGRLVRAAPPFEPATLVAEVTPLDGTTLYARLGDWPGWAALLSAPWMLVGRGRRRQAG